MKHRAFTLVEMLIVVLVVGSVTVGLAVSLIGARGQAGFNEAKAEITNMLQEARELSLSNILIEPGVGLAFETDYYFLEVRNDRKMILTAYGANDSGEEVSSEISRVDLNERYDMEFDDVYRIYYIPPYGEICFKYSGSCVYEGQPTEITFELSRENSDQKANFTVSIYSGYPEVD